MSDSPPERWALVIPDLVGYGHFYVLRVWPEFEAQLAAHILAVYASEAEARRALVMIEGWVGRLAIETAIRAWGGARSAHPPEAGAAEGSDHGG